MKITTSQQIQVFEKISQGNDQRKPTISITMASYNVAPYIVAALDSVLAQEFTDFEFIIVDDASTDGTREILKDYATRDMRIRLFLKERNEGLSVARNLGIAHARGDWVTFLDADDLFSPEMLRLAVQAGRNTSAEMVLWDYVVFTKETEISAKATLPSALTRIDPADRVALLNRPAFACTRLVSSEALTRLQIKFPPGLTYQDVPVHWRLITQIDKIALVPQRLVYYRQQPQATTAGKGIKRADFFIVLDEVEAYLHDSGLFDTYADSLTARQLNAWHGVYDVIAHEHKPLVRNLIVARFGERHRTYLKTGKHLRWQARAFFSAVDGDRLAQIRLALHNLARGIYRQLKIWN